LIGLKFSSEQKPKIIEELNKLEGKRITVELIYRDPKKEANEQFAYCLVARPWLLVCSNFKCIRLWY